VAIVTGSTPVRRRLVGAALRRHRESIGFPLDIAASILDCDRSKVSRIETGQRGIRARELRELLTEYGVPDAEQDILQAIARVGRAGGDWWRPYGDVLPDAARDYIALESCASDAMVYEPQRVPELLQTADYAARSFGPGPGAADRDRLVEVILTRQEALRERALRLEVVIGEAALRQSVGAPEVMRAQLRRLAALAEQPGPVTIQVLPFTAGARAAGASGPITIFRYEKAPALGVVHLATLNGGLCETGADEVSRYSRAFARVKAAAASTSTSARLLREMAWD
jgi:transcriptional regulator with XRE-family HTH domain